MDSSGAAARSLRVWLALALLVFAGATADRYAAVLEAGLRQAIPSRSGDPARAPLVRSDQEFVVWAVSRNAHTLATRPWRLFEAEQCFPEPHSLALGEPVIALGVLAIPGWLLTRDPILTYNLLVFAMAACAALAMYWLVAAWTGEPTAGIAAGLLYAFHGLPRSDPIHPYSSDTTWMVLALVLANRWLEGGRWRDALAFAAAAAMQMATSFYSLVAAGLVGLPVAAWLCVRHRKTIRWGQVAGVAAALLVAGAVLFRPFLAAQSSGLLADRPSHFFGSWWDHAPGGKAFFGFGPWLLVAAGLFVPRRLGLARLGSEPRPALVAGGLLAAGVAAGPGGILGFDLYAALSALLPGFATVRIPWKIAVGVHLVLCVLSGVGAAGLLRLLPLRVRTPAGLLLVAIVAGALCFAPARPDPASLALRPPAELIALFEELSARGNAGPIFDEPSPTRGGHFGWTATARQLLLAAWHGRPTSACYPSHAPASRPRLEAVAAMRPSRKAVLELHALGFTTIVVRHIEPPSGSLEQPARTPRGRLFHNLAGVPGGPLRLVYETPWASAYEIAE